MSKKTAISVVIDASSANSHRVKVTIRAQAGILPAQLSFPVWTPGSYLLREYSRHVTLFQGGHKVGKNTWRLNPDAEEVSYEVYCFERTVRTSYLDSNYAVFVGATLLPLLPEKFSVEFRFPQHWTLAASALPLKKKGAGVWTAEVRDSDQWIDSPVAAAAPSFGQVTRFRAAGITHEFAWVGMECARPLTEITKDCAKISETVIKLFGGAPFKRYTTIFHFGYKLYGGLEHRDSQLSQYDGGALADKKEYENFLRLYAHEYFHAWNVKSLRPEALGPFDYSQENYTEDLWFAEGLTDYFDEMIPYLAGVTSSETYWQSRCKGLNANPDGFPGHKRRSLAESSLDAWIRYYRPDEDSANTDVSYYAKGAQLGLCWDALLQKKSRGRWNLAKLMRAFWKEFGIGADEELRHAKAGYRREDLLNFAEKITKIKQKAQVEAWVTSRKALPWAEALRSLKVNWKSKVTDPAQNLWGVQLQPKNGALSVVKVYAGSTGERAGLSAGDDILALGEDRVFDMDSFQATLKKLKGRQFHLLVSRLNKVFTAEVVPTRHAGLGEEIEFAGVRK